MQYFLTMFTQYNQSELTGLIQNQVEENLRLDYKGADSLAKTEPKKKEISKDVSAFANSDGGTIIYGIKEFDDQARRHLPESISPVDRINITKEWLEQVINSNIQPKIQGIIITPITLNSSENHVSYVVEIPKSNTAHQANDKRYYKRYNFESVAMDDYEIRDILNRQTNPEIQLVLDSTSVTFNQDIFTFAITLMNSSIRMARDVKMTMEIIGLENYEVVTINNLNDLSPFNPGRRLYGSENDLRIYKLLNIQVGTISFRLLNGDTSILCKTNIYADGMEPIVDRFRIIVNGANVSFEIVE